jgi:hypothetical protein
MSNTHGSGSWIGRPPPSCSRGDEVVRVRWRGSDARRSRPRSGA